VAAAAAPAALAATDPTAVDLPSPLLGTFYRSPKPGAPPFVQVGSQVEADSIIGIIEVMKLMNTVRAGVRGTVAEFLARMARSSNTARSCCAFARALDCHSRAPHSDCQPWRDCRADYPHLPQSGH